MVLMEDKSLLVHSFSRMFDIDISILFLATKAQHLLGDGRIDDEIVAAGCLDEDRNTCVTPEQLSYLKPYAYVDGNRIKLPGYGQ